MTKYVLLLMVTVGLVFINSGCTSNKTEGESEIVENADAEKIEAEDLDVTENTQGTDPSLEDSLGETTVTTATSEPAPPTDSTTTTVESADAAAAPTLDETSLDLDTPSPTTTAENATPEVTSPEATPAPVVSQTTATEMAESDISSTPAPAPDLGSSIAETPIGSVDSVPVDVTPSSSSFYSSTPVSSGKILKKIAQTQPYQTKDGSWVNTVYVARPKEKLSDISFKIYGTDKSKELKNIAENSYLKNRSAKAGDKIYYVSPNRPNDSSKMMVYYEDMGAIPETYVTKKGDRLPKIAKELLGYSDAWKEIWTSNSVESKSKLKEGETLRYWRAEGGAPPPQLAQSSTNTTTSEPAPTLVDTPPTMGATDQQTNNLPPPPADMPALPSPPTDANFPPPGDPNAPVVNNETPPATENLPPPPTEPPPPPPPPAPDIAAQEPEKPKVDLDRAAEEEAAAEEGLGGLDSDTMMSMGGIGLLVALFALVIIRKKKQKAQMNDNDINI